MAKKKKQVPNEVFIYDLYLNQDFCVTRKSVYTKPFKKYKSLGYRNGMVIGSYFTKEKIEELKQELIQKIKDCDDPFVISLADHDGNYNVSEEELFNIEETVQR